MIMVGTVTTRPGHKIHRHANGWATCGAGRLIGSPRIITDDDQLCRRCAPHLHHRLVREIDDMRRKHCGQRATMLERVMDSGLSATELAWRQAFFVELGASLTASWTRRERSQPLPVVDRYADTLTLF